MINKNHLILGSVVIVLLLIVILVGIMYMNYQNRSKDAVNAIYDYLIEEKKISSEDIKSITKYYNIKGNSNNAYGAKVIYKNEPNLVYYYDYIRPKGIIIENGSGLLKKE